MNWNKCLLLAICICSLSSTLKAQYFSGSLLSEFQYGNIPFANPTDLSTLYNQVNLNMQTEKFTFFARAEQFLNPFSAREYAQISQYRISFNKDRLDIKFGHFYDIIGRGLLYRSFEIPSTVFEDQVNRVRQGFYRDSEGLRISYQFNNVEVKALWQDSADYQY